jgi:hypothetical protein
LNLLEHIEDDLFALTQMRDSLAPCGKLTPLAPGSLRRVRMLKLERLSNAQPFPIEWENDEVISSDTNSTNRCP